MTIQPQVDIRIDGDTIIIICGPYNPCMCELFRTYSAQWTDNKQWVLPDVPAVRRMLKSKYNWVPGCGTFWKEIYLNAEGIKQDGKYIYYEGYVLAYRPYRDSPVQSPRGVVTDGTYKASGGSEKYPDVLEGASIKGWSLLMYDGAGDCEETNNLRDFSTEELLRELERRGETLQDHERN